MKTVRPHTRRHVGVPHLRRASLVLRARVRPTQFLFLALVAFILPSYALSAEDVPPVDLRYSGQKDATIAYRIEITADRYDATDTLKGVVTYKFNTVTDYLIRATYSGCLVKSSVSKPSSTLSPFHGPRYASEILRSSRAFGPFARPRFQGLTPTTNELTLTPLGEVRSMQGESQLPFLLGNASLLVFEPLPEKPKQAWSMSMGLSITEETGNQGSPFPYMPFPRGPFDEPEPVRTTAGSEIQTYLVRSVEGPLVVVDKTYRLESPAVGDDASSFEINGTGMWTFNRELGLSESLQLTQKVVAQRGETTASFPMTISYTRMPDEEYATYQAEQKRKQEEAQRELAARREIEANTPLTVLEIDTILDELKSDNASIVLSALRKLQAKNPKASNPRIALALAALENHENSFVRQNVAELAGKWPMPEGLSAAALNTRTWSDRTGTFSVEAKFVELNDDTVYLERSNGETLKIRLNQLSEDDQQTARQLAEILKPPTDLFQ